MEGSTMAVESQINPWNNYLFHLVILRNSFKLINQTPTSYMEPNKSIYQSPRGDICERITF